MLRNLRQNAVLLIVVLSFFALSFAFSSGTAAQTKKSAKTTPTPKKTTVKATPTPDKKAQAKATPTPKKAATAKSKTDDKKATSAKTPVKDKNSKTPSKNKETASKTTASTKTKETAADKKTAASKSSKTDSKTAAKNSKTAATTKKTADTKQPADAKPPVKKPTAAKTTTNRIPVKVVDENLDNAPQIIVTDVSARIRSQAKTGAPEMMHPKLGTVLKVAEKTPAWYRVQFTDGAKTSSGWISAISVNDLKPSAKDQIYRQIADRYYKPEGMDFTTASELYEFLNSVSADTSATDSAELELKKLLALRSALRSIPPEKTNEKPYSDFLKAQEKSVVYSEPAGEWYANSNLFWDLHKKYESSPLADRIAWEGAQNPLPGECEGYVNCYLFYARMTSGEYLSLHPTGKNSLEALNNITNFLEPIAAGIGGNSSYNGPTDVTDRAEFNNLIAEMRTIISRLPLTEKEKPLQLLKKIAEGFR